jgi:carotenoid cleavage dioxygenase-like enzyme
MVSKQLTRRAFTKGLLTGSAALLVNPRVAIANSEEQHAPWAAAFEGVTTDLGPLEMAVNGRIPVACNGTLYRNGPALYERGGQRYGHWFDPDGMIQSFSIRDNSVSHAGRFVRTEKFQREERAGRFLFDGAGSTIKGSLPTRNNEDINVANTNVQLFQGELLALWEGGSAHRLDPDTLQTLGKKSWREDLQGVPFSAHPRFDELGGMWNIGSAPMPGNPAMVLFHIGKNGDLKKVRVQPLDFGGYQHDFLLTPNYLIALNSSAVAHHGDHFVDMFQWEAKRPSQLLVFDRNNFALLKTIEVPPAFVFHFGNAWEKSGKVIFTAAQYADAQFMQHGMARLAQQKRGPYHNHSPLMRYSVDLKNSRVEIEKVIESIEFPSFDKRFPFTQQNVIGVSERNDAADSLQSTILEVNSETGSQQRYDYGEDVIIEEPQFISDGTATLGSGYILHSYLDFRKQRTGIAVLRSGAVAEGPIAIAEMDRCMPLGFHGCFVAA